MPTPETAEAFAKLAAARARLNDISRDLNEALEARGTVAGEQVYRELQERWRDAFHSFETAAEEFHIAVRQAHDELEASTGETP